MKPFAQIRGVLWDLDGVIADTRDLHFLAMAEALRPYGIDYPRPIFEQTFGTNLHTILQVTLGREPEPEFTKTVVAAHAEAFSRGAAAGVHPLPGVLETLQFFRERGLPQAIASSSDPLVIEAVLAGVGAKPYFEALVSGSELPGKPDPAVYLCAAERLQVPPEDCLVIEDSPAGVQGARAAGATALAVATTYPRHRLAHADIIFDTLEEFLKGSYARLKTT